MRFVGAAVRTVVRRRNDASTFDDTSSAAADAEVAAPESVSVRVDGEVAAALKATRSGVALEAMALRSVPTLEDVGEAEAATKAACLSQREREAALPQQSRVNVVRPSPPAVYDPKAHYRNFVRLQHTAIKQALLRIDFWLLCGTHIVLSIFYHGSSIFGIASPDEEELARRQRGETMWPAISIETMLIMGSFLTFFLVFFNSQSYNGFFQTYMLSRALQMHANTFALLSRAHVRLVQRQLTMLRLVHAALFLGFVQLQINSDIEGFREDALKKLVQMLCLSEEEAHILRGLQIGMMADECLLWAMSELAVELERGAIKPSMHRTLEAPLIHIRDSFDKLRALEEQSIPFSYYHLVICISEIYLAILAYAAVTVTPHYSILGYVVTSFIVLGMREVAAELAEPLGQDEHDIPIFDQLHDLHLNHILNATRLGRATPSPDPPAGYGSVHHINVASARELDPSVFLSRRAKERVDNGAAEEAALAVARSKPSQPSLGLIFLRMLSEGAPIERALRKLRGVIPDPDWHELRHRRPLRWPSNAHAPEVERLLRAHREERRQERALRRESARGAGDCSPDKYDACLPEERGLLRRRRTARGGGPADEEEEDEAEEQADANGDDGDEDGDGGYGEDEE
mmetsp:Transcript_24760/g.80951  ORF Transcript_24760/g.80951 Transcript_24760/m.80951 type:complete len:632 (+) Transcript_24760:217-2112(+)